MTNFYFIALSDQIYSFILSSIVLHVAPITLYSFLIILLEECKLWPFSLRISSTFLAISLSAHTTPFYLISQANRNEYQVYSLGVKAAGGKADNLTTILHRCHEIWVP